MKQDALAELEPEAGDEAAGPAQKAQEQEEEEDEFVEASGVRAPAKLFAPGQTKKRQSAAVTAAGSAKAKAKDKDKTKGREKKKDRMLAGSACVAGSAAVALGADARSACGSGKTKASKLSSGERCVTKVQGWMDDLDVRKFLTGAQNWRDSNFARSSLAALESRRPGSAEGVMLAARLDLCKKAEERLLPFSEKYTGAKWESGSRALTSGRRWWRNRHKALHATSTLMKCHVACLGPVILLTTLHLVSKPPK